MSGRAKFYVISITHHNGGHREVKMSPVYSSDKSTENYSFWTASPNGELRLYITNPAAFEQFEVGKEYYLDLSAAPEAAKGV